MTLVTCLTMILNPITLVLIALIVLYYKSSYTYWQRKNIPFRTPVIPFGNISAQTLTTSMHENIKTVYDEMKSKGYKHCGLYLFTRPIYIVMDPEYIKAVLTKDFTHFADRGLYYNEKDDPINCHLLVLEEEKWRRLRTKFTPTFTLAKTKMMFEGLMGCSEQMLEAMQRVDEAVDIKEVCACFTTDVIGTCVFGINCNSFDENKAEFRQYGRRLFQLSLPFILKVIFCSSFKSISRRLGIRIVDREIASFFMQVIKDTLKYREKHGVVRNDFLQLLMDMRKQDQEGLSVNQIAAQCFLFFAAGFETSSVTMTFCIYELVHAIEVQEKLRAEIEKVIALHGGELTYEAILEMKYLNQVVEETMRKHPSVPNIPRICTRPYKLPGGDHYLERGTHVFIPIYALHRDPEIYPDPEKFDPDRFSEKNKAKRHHYAYLPFGEGPRVCLGLRFGLLQVKVGLITLLRNYSFSPSAKTRNPLRYDKASIFLTVKDPVWVNASRIRH